MPLSASVANRTLKMGDRSLAEGTKARRDPAGMGNLVYQRPRQLELSLGQVAVGGGTSPAKGIGVRVSISGGPAQGIFIL